MFIIKLIISEIFFTVDFYGCTKKRSGVPLNKKRKRDREREREREKKIVAIEQKLMFLRILISWFSFQQDASILQNAIFSNFYFVDSSDL